MPRSVPLARQAESWWRLAQDLRLTLDRGEDPEADIEEARMLADWTDNMSLKGAIFRGLGRLTKRDCGGCPMQARGNCSSCLANPQAEIRRLAPR